MAIATLESWLNDPLRKYTAGKLLYDQHGRDILLKALFANGSDSTPYQFNRLHDALKQISDECESGELPAALKAEVKAIADIFKPAFAKLQTAIVKPMAQPFVQVPIEQIPVPAKLYGVSDKDWEKLPDQIKDLYTENSRLNSHSQLLFNQCRATENKDNRLQLDLVILDERDRINNNWKIIKDFHNDGLLYLQVKEQATKTVEQMTFGELAKNLKNIPTYISKARKRLALATTDKNIQEEQLKIKGWELQLVLINNRLEAGK